MFSKAAKLRPGQICYTNQIREIECNLSPERGRFVGKIIWASAWIKTITYFAPGIIRIGDSKTTYIEKSYLRQLLLFLFIDSVQ